MNDETPLTGGERTEVSRRGDIIYRQAGKWSQTVVALLKHLEQVDFSHAPRIIGSGFDEHGRETLSFIKGEFVHPGPWSDESMYALGTMLKQLHLATSSFRIPSNAIWRPWFGRNIGAGPVIIGHCDLGLWNIVSKAGLPIGLIDWEVAGPVNRDTELAQACWLNAQLVDDDIAERVGLATTSARARQVRLLLDGYGLSRKDRLGFVEKIIDFVIQDAAEQAIEARVTPESEDLVPLWAITWRTRSASWIIRNRRTIQNALD